MVEDPKKIMVIKSGGAEGNTFDFVLDDLAKLWHQGKRWVYVHGGAARTNEISEQLGHPPEFVTTKAGFTSRRTDRRTVEIFTMVYAGEINKILVEGLQKRGVNAVGLSGADGRILEGERKKALRVISGEKHIILHDDYTGTIRSVNDALLLSLIDQGFAPVLCPPAISLEHELINVDGDRAAAAVANALGSSPLILLTGISGLLRDINDPSSLVETVLFSEIEGAIQRYAKGRMRIKLLAAKEALSGNVDRVIISKSDIENPISKALEGSGTQFIKDEYD